MKNRALWWMVRVVAVLVFAASYWCAGPSSDAHAL